MISSSRLNKSIFSVIFFTVLTFNSGFAEDEAVDIWEKQENQKEQSKKSNNEKNITIKSPILSDNVNKIIIKIDENNIEAQNKSVFGIFDPAKNNFKLVSILCECFYIQDENDFIFFRNVTP